MKRKIIIIIQFVLIFAVHLSFGQTNSIRKAMFESDELLVTLSVKDLIIDNDDSLSISIYYKNKSFKDLFIYDPSFSINRSDFIKNDTATAEALLEIGGSFLWDLGRPNALKLKKIRPQSSYLFNMRIKIPRANHYENHLLFNDVYARKQYIQLVYCYIGYISDLRGIKLIQNGSFVRFGEASELNEVVLFEKNYRRILAGPLLVICKNSK